MIGIIGGIGVGYSAGYKWQTVFNTFGALAIAASLFGLPMALLLRSGINVTASLYTVVCNVVYDKLHGKKSRNRRKPRKTIKNTGILQKCVL